MVNEVKVEANRPLVETFWKTTFLRHPSGPSVDSTRPVRVVDDVIRTSAGPAPGACAWRTQVAGAQCPGSDASVNSVITAEVVCEFGGTDHGHAARQQHAVLTALVVQGPLRGCRCLLPSPPCNCPSGSTFHHLRLGLSRHVAKRSLSQHEGQRSWVCFPEAEA